MYDIKQFRPVLYLVVLVGITGYAMASETIGLWTVAVSLILTSAWLIHRDQFKPIPRLLANAITLLCFAIAYFDILRHTTAIMAVGQFLVLLQVVKIWEQRANRDYAQLLVLSLLLMVAAAISTGSLLFGLTFIVYLFLSLYCCLLFHLKVETDQAKEALSPATERWGEAALKHDQKFLSRSMRRLTGLVATYALIAAVVVFLLFPRGTGAGIFGQLAWKPRDPMTGFSEDVSFNNVARIAENDAQLGTIKIYRRGQPLSFQGPLMIRGVTHDYYSGNDNSHLRALYQWSNSPDGTNDRRGRWFTVTAEPDGTRVMSTSPRDGRSHLPQYREEIYLSPTGTPALFSLPGIISVKPEESLRHITLQRCVADQTIGTDLPLQAPLNYEVITTNTLNGYLSGPEMLRLQELLDHPRSNIDPLITSFARRPEVAGDLAKQRDALFAARADKRPFYVSPIDDQIARRIETYLQHYFTYTLDLTDVHRVPGRDPIVGFLYDFKRGHCEYFAGAMTLMCQSLGLTARLVVGFKCDDYNDFGHFYTLRQSQAHAWVEVLTTDGWKTYDPTSGKESPTKTASLWQKTRHFFDFMEYAWQNSVIAYNSNNRQNLIDTVDTTLSRTASRGASNFSGFAKWFGDLRDKLASAVIGPLLCLLVLAILAAFGWFFFERWKLRRKATRIGIKDLPLSDQAKLVRQLGFYDDLLRLLEKHRITRPAHLTPMEFSSSLSFLPGEAYDTIRRLTGLFYKIRYGTAELDDGQRKRIGNVIDRLSRTMATSDE